MYLLEREQIIPATLDEAWSFFSNPQNLAKITPPDLGFEVLDRETDTIHDGQELEYRVTPLPGMKTRWVSRITGVDEPRGFTDEQKVGPYRMWRHEHRFERTDDDRVRIVDTVRYRMPFGWLGRLVHAVLVRPRLERIFDFRKRVLKERFK